MRDSSNTVIVGAGITGLVLAYALTRDGHDVVLVEKEQSVGGLAKSHSYDGFVFDVGPHRFHSDRPEVNDLIHEVLQDDFRMIVRKSGVHMFGTYFDWPLGVGSAFKLPPAKILPILLDLMRKKKPNSGNFEDYIVSKYGNTLYEIFFKAYTEKFLRIPCTDISRDWAITGIDRAVIDKKGQFNDLLSLAKTLFGAKPVTRFIYPESGGMQAFCDLLRQRIVENGGKVLVNAQVDGIEHDGAQVRGVSIAGAQYRCEQLVWTAPINEVLSLLGEPRADLNYLSLLLYNYQLNTVPRADYQWCYFSGSEIPFNRVSLPTMFNPSLAPAGCSGACVEVTCRESDELWRTPGLVEPAIREKLRATGLIRGNADIIGCQVERVPHAYPIYSMGYKAVLDDTLRSTGRYRNLKLLGRTGAFWYNNMDHSIEAALSYYRELTGVPAYSKETAPAVDPFFPAGYREPQLQGA